MDENLSSSRSRFAWLRGLAKLCRVGLRRRRHRRVIRSRNDKAKCDIGLAVDGYKGVRDVRAEFYAKMMQRGWPLL